MLNLSSVMLGSKNVEVMAKFYEELFGKPADMVDGDWHGWSVGNAYFSLGSHSEVGEKAQDPNRIIFNFETKEVKEEFERIKQISGAVVIKDPYTIGEGLIATFADPDGNFFQLMAPWN